MSTTIFCIALFFSGMLQVLLPQIWTPLKFVDFFVILVFQSSWKINRETGVLYGWSAGLIQDMLMVSSYPIGLQATGKMVVGLLSGSFTRNLNMDHPGIQSLMVFTLTLVNNFVVFLHFLIFGLQCPINDWLQLLFSAAMTTLFNFPVWWFRYYRHKSV